MDHKQVRLYPWSPWCINHTYPTNKTRDRTSLGFVARSPPSCFVFLERPSPQFHGLPSQVRTRRTRDRADYRNKEMPCECLNFWRCHLTLLGHHEWINGISHGGMEWEEDQGRGGRWPGVPVVPVGPAAKKSKALQLSSTW